jgi:hypothetical protein
MTANGDWFDVLDGLDFEPEMPISIAEVAVQRGVSIATYISQMVHSGMLLEEPDCIDPWCLPGGDGRFPAMRIHVDDCGCGFIPVPHPDLVELP